MSSSCPENVSTPQFATTLIRAGTAGAETRHLRMIEKLQRQGFSLEVETLELQVAGESSGRRRSFLPIVLRKVLAGFRTMARRNRSRTSYFAFDPYVFMGAAVAARARGAKALYFCRNDQIYQLREIRKRFHTRNVIPFRLYALQLGCLLLCTRYIVQSDFARDGVIQRYSWVPFLRLDRKVHILNNDVHLPVAALRDFRLSETLHVAFVSNAAYAKKGFSIVEQLVQNPAFLSAPLQLKLVGAGPAFDQLLIAADSAAGPGRVTYCGYIAGPDLIPDLADVVFVPTVVDHFPNLLIECAALGVPMLLSDIEAHRHIFPEHPGYFSLSATSEDIVAHLLKLRDPEARCRIVLYQKLAVSRFEAAWDRPLLSIFEIV